MNLEVRFGDERAWQSAPHRGQDVAQITAEIRKASLELQVQRQVDQRMAKTGSLRVVTAIRRDIGIEILGRRRRTNENEAIMVVRAMQDLARDRGEERLGALGLAMVDQQSDEMQLDAIPQGVGAAARKARRAKFAFDALDGFRSTAVVEVDAIPNDVMDCEPIARLEIGAFVKGVNPQWGFSNAAKRAPTT